VIRKISEVFMTVSEIVGHLTKHAVRPSPQRVAVMQYLCEHRTHPTAEMVYSALLPDYPTLSRTTVYQTLDLTCSIGMAQKIVIEEGEMRFDADVSDHGHFKCTNCDEVFDFFYPQATVFPKPAGAFEIKEQHLYYKGLCPTCRQSMKMKKRGHRADG